jgi:aspartyl-tRNA(Asn)/glutamyl-tRNA(Gln) amidotransferase subunit C
MSIEAQTVRRLFELSKLSVQEEEIEGFQKDLAAMLDYAKSLEEIDTDGVEPTFFITPQANVFREDIVHPSQPSEKVLQEAPTKIHRYFRLPKVIENI